MSLALKSTGLSHFGAKFREEWVDRCKSKCKAMWQRRTWGCRMVQFEHNARTWQTDRQTDHRRVTSMIDTNRTWTGSWQQTAKYADLRAQYVFQPVSVENMGPFSSSALDFLRDLGRRISHISGDDREVLFLFQRISVTIQRFNSVLLHDSFSIDRPDH